MLWPLPKSVVRSDLFKMFTLLSVNNGAKIGVLHVIKYINPVRHRSVAVVITFS